jgi:hypothetical protein
MALLPRSVHVERESRFKHQAVVVPNLDCHLTSGNVNGMIASEYIFGHVSQRICRLLLHSFNAREF